MNKFKGIIIMLAIIFLITPTYGLVVKTGTSVDIPEDETIDDDLIVFSQTVTIEGTVNGDVYAVARDVTVNGEVSGSIFSGGATVAVRNGRTIWAMGGDVKVTGAVDNNVILFGGKLLIGENARIGKDVRVYGGKFTMEGEIGGDLKGGVGNFVMTGKSGDIDIRSDEVKIESGAEIAGDLVVRGGKEPVIEEEATISGEVTLKKVEKGDEKAFIALAPFIAFFVSFMRIVMLIAKIIVGIIIIALSKRFVRQIMDTLITKPWKSLGWGFLGIIVIPVAIVILFVVLIGYPLAIFGTFNYLILFYLTPIFVGLVVGEKIIQLFKKEGEISLYLSFIVGIVVLFVLGLIPILGFIIKLFVLLFGVGMLLVGSWNLMREARAKNLI